MSEERIISTSFIMDLERILDRLSKNKNLVAKIGNITINCIGGLEDVEVFEIERNIGGKQ